MKARDGIAFRRDELKIRPAGNAKSQSHGMNLDGVHTLEHGCSWAFPLMPLDEGIPCGYRGEIHGRSARLGRIGLTDVS